MKEIKMGTPKIAQVGTSIWKIDPAHTAAEFKVTHMMITNVKGQFSGVSGTLSLDEQDVTNSKVEVTIPTATINTREPDRDTHLKSSDFFDHHRREIYQGVTTISLQSEKSPGIDAAN